MPGIKFYNSAKDPRAWGQNLYDWFGWNPNLIDGVWHVPEDDPALRNGPADILKIQNGLELTPDKFPKIAEILANHVPDEFDNLDEKTRHELPKEVAIADNYGVLTTLDDVTMNLLFCKRHEVAAVVEKKLLPLMYEELSQRWVFPVTLSASQQQRHFSLAKTAYLAGAHGPEALDEFILDKGVFGGIEMTAGIEILSAVEAMMLHTPIAFSLPVRRHGCTWHFVGKGFTVMPRAGLGMPNMFHLGITPRSQDGSAIGFSKLKGMNSDSIWRLLRQIVWGANRLMKHVNDPRTFKAKDGTVDWFKQMQAFGALRLIFADMQAVSMSNSIHVRLTHTFAFIDKLANLRRVLGGHPGKDKDSFNALLSVAQGEKLVAAIKKHVQPKHPDLAKSLSAVISNAYEELHAHVADEMGEEGTDEAARLKRLGAFRNLIHGAYLDFGQFERVFATAEGTVPKDIVTLPFALTLGLMLSPEEFISFEPEA